MMRSIRTVHELVLMLEFGAEGTVLLELRGKLHGLLHGNRPGPIVPPASEAVVLVIDEGALELIDLVVAALECSV